MAGNKGTSRSGVTGIFSIGTGTQFGGDVYQWKRGLSIPTRDRSGRGGPRWGQFRRLNVGSEISFRMNGTGRAFPAPIGMENARGTVVIQYDTGKTVTCTGEIIQYNEAFDAGKNTGSAGDDVWDIGVSMRLTAAPAYAGWPATQQTPSTQTYGDQELDAGGWKVVDLNQLQSRATRAVDVGTITDTDYAEKAKILQLATSAAPLSGTVFRTGQINRTDRGGAVATLEYGLRDTKQDVEFPATSRVIDPFHLRSLAASATVLSGAIPSSESYLTSGETRYEQLTGNRYVTVKNFAPRNSKQDVEMPATERFVDPFSLQSHATSAIVTSGSIPTTQAVLTSAGVDYRQLTPGRYVAVKRFAPRSSKQDVEYPSTERFIDPFHLQSHAASAIVLSGSIPSTDSVLTSAGVDYRQLTPGQFVAVKRFGPRSSKQEVEFPATERFVDPFGIESHAASAVVLNGTIPSTESFLTSAGIDYRQLTPGQYVAVKRMDTLNSVNRREFAATVSKRSGQEAVDDTGVVLVSPIATSVETEADAQFGVYQNLDNFDELQVSLIDKRYKMLNARFKDVGLKVEFESGDPQSRYLPAVLVSSTLKVYLQDVKVLAGSVKRVWHRSMFLNRARRRFTAWRWFSQPPPIPDHASLSGKVNNATFCGLAAGTVMFIRAIGSANFDLAGNVPMYIGYQFITDDAGFYDYQGYHDQWFDTTAAVSRGLNAISLFTNGEIAVQTPASADFSVF